MKGGILHWHAPVCSTIKVLISGLNHLYYLSKYTKTGTRSPSRGAIPKEPSQWPITQTAPRLGQGQAAQRQQHECNCFQAASDQNKCQPL
jgi:hypothetical protein